MKFKFTKNDYHKKIDQGLSDFLRANITADDKREISKRYNKSFHTLERVCNRGYNLAETNSDMILGTVEVAIENAKSHIRMKMKQLAEFDY